MNVNIYLAIQRFRDGRVMYRRWSPQLKTKFLGGAFHPITEEATAWLRMRGNPEWDSIESDSTRGGIDPPYQPFRVVQVNIELVAESLL